MPFIEKDIIGMKFGKLKVLEKDGKHKKQYTYTCQCDCGNIRKYTLKGGLTRGKTKSCGCDHPISSLGANLTFEEYYEHTRKRLLKGIKENNGCWEWQGSLNNKGYPFQSWGQKPNKKKTTLHRVSYLVWKGEIEKGKCVLHKCDNPKCINPEHLYIGTYKDNTKDVLDRGRGNAPKGSKAGMSKLTEWQVVEIRKMREEGKTLKEIGDHFSMTGANICDICKRKTWKHVK